VKTLATLAAASALVAFGCVPQGSGGGGGGQSLIGESCASTLDCANQARCIEQTCVPADGQRPGDGGPRPTGDGAIDGPDGPDGGVSHDASAPPTRTDDAAVDPTDGAEPPPPADAAKDDPDARPETPDAFVVEPPPGDQDTRPSPAGWFPGARTTFLEIPTTHDDARAAGCDLLGANNGTGLSGLLALAGTDLNELLQPNEEGHVTVVQLSYLDDWADRRTGNQTEQADLRFFTGRDAAEGFVAQDEFANFRNADVRGARLRGAGDFGFELPIVEGLPLVLELRQTTVQGDLRVEDGGFGLSNGTIAGYLTRADLVALIAGIQAVCAQDDPPELCGVIEQVLPLDADPEAVMPLILQFIGGFDAGWDGARASACDPGRAGDCGAVSVCFMVEFSPQRFELP
jgi:hypothetical protein